MTVRPKTYAMPQTLFALLTEKGESVPQMLSSLGIDPLIVLQPMARLPEKDYLNVLREAQRIIQDPALGLHLGEVIRPGTFSLVGYTAMSSETLGKAFEKIARYKKLMGESNLQVEHRAEKSIMTYQVASEAMSGGLRQSFVEASLSFLFSFGRWLTQREWQPESVAFEFPEPEYGEEFRRIFKAPVQFECHHNELVLHRDLWDLPVYAASPGVQTVFETQADRLLNELEGTGFVDQVQHVLKDLLQGEIPSIEKVAKRLGMSSRTLQRHLQEEGVSFQEVLAEIQKQLAMEYIHQHKLEMGEVSYLLGFADVSSFYRAFKRWTGMAPVAFSKSMN